MESMKIPTICSATMQYCLAHGLYKEQTLTLHTLKIAPKLFLSVYIQNYKVKKP